MTEWSYDGHPIQAGANQSDFSLVGNYAHFSILDTREMVVVARYYVDDPLNRSKRFVEYACRDLHTSEVYPGCRQLSMMSGIDDGDDNTLRPSTKMVPGATGVTGALVNEHTPASDVDGDQVLVGFISGSRSRPVILGVFRHSSSQYGATSAQGERRLTVHKGTSVEIQQDGTYILVPAAERVAKLGSAGAADAAVLGTTYRSAEDTMLSAISTVLSALGVYAAAIQGVADPSNLATPTLTAALAACESAISAFQSSAPSYLSTKVSIG